MQQRHWPPDKAPVKFVMDMSTTQPFLSAENLKTDACKKIHKIDNDLMIYYLHFLY